MRLAIADPPYPPNLLASSRATGHGPRARATRWYAGKDPRTKGCCAADAHPEARQWDDPGRHRELREQLDAEYDGWAIATTMDAVATGIYAPLQYGTRVLVWVKGNAIPTGARIASMCEAVLLLPPAGRSGRARPGAGTVRDVLHAGVSGQGFAGAKPAAWTRWVLDALGYDPEQDTVDDLFPGSGAVSAEIAQGVLL